MPRDRQRWQRRSTQLLRDVIGQIKAPVAIVIQRHSSVGGNLQALKNLPPIHTKERAYQSHFKTRANQRPGAQHA
jgi:hypothetical protein